MEMASGFRGPRKPRRNKKNIFFGCRYAASEAVMAMEVWADTVYVAGLPKDVTEQR